MPNTPKKLSDLLRASELLVEQVLQPEQILPLQQIPLAIPQAPVQRPEVSQRQVDYLRRLLAEKAKRSIDGLSLYRPMASQADFHASLAKERILRGSNRGGKTLPASVELARAVQGLDPFRKYPQRDGRAYVVGRDEKHLGETMWRKLSRAGAFRIVKDPATGLWRAFHPPTDVGLAHLSKPAPPLIPHRAIVSIIWKSKAAGIPEKVVLTTGWEILFFSSLGKPPRGADIDIVWFDEEIIDGEWYGEMSARLIDRSGHFWWSATPQSGTEQLLELHEKASEQRSLPSPRVTEHFVHIRDNIHISEEDKKDFAAKLRDAEYNVRYEGEFAIITALIYPEWDTALHCCPYFPIPQHWTRYVAVDPGRQVLAATFCAIPAPEDEEAGRVFFYDEIYIRNANARLFGDEMRHKCQGQQIYAFIIDRHGGKHTEGGTGLSLMEHYSRALKKNEVKSIATGYSFWLSSDNPVADTEAFRAWLLPRDSDDPKKGGPVLSVFSDKCPNFLREIKKYRHPRDRGVVTDKIPHKGDVHLMDTARYLAAHRPSWVAPPQGVRQPSGALKAFREKMERLRQKEFGSETEYVRLG